MKTLYEYHYAIGDTCATDYKLVVDRETNKMFYGNVFVWDNCIGRFSVKKENLNKLTQYIDRSHGTICKVIVDAENHKAAATQIIRDYLQNIVNNFQL